MMFAVCIEDLDRSYKNPPRASSNQDSTAKILILGVDETICLLRKYCSSMMRTATTVAAIGATPSLGLIFVRDARMQCRE